MQTAVKIPFACIVTATLAAPLYAQPSVQGQWTGVFSWGTAGGVEAIHMAMLPTGKVMFWQYSASSVGLWDPVTQQFSAAALPGHNPFCSGHAWLADGRLLVAGGHVSNNNGENRANIYNPFTNTWANNVPNMPNVPSGAPYGVGRNGRWYPGATTLGNGDVLMMSGDMNGNPPGGQSDTNPLPHIYQAATNTWRNLTTAYNQLPLYPRAFLAPSGHVFSLSDFGGNTERLDTSGTGSWTTVANTIFDGHNSYGSAVMYDTGKVVFIGGGDGPTATAEKIDLNLPNPTWSPAGSMAQPRRQHNATILADGTVLVAGGSSVSGFNNSAGQVALAEIWNPATNSFTPVAPASSVYRGYHTTALLLPDGRVLMAGGNHDSPNYTENRNAEIYSPPHLFNGPRPTVTSAPDTAELGRTFFVATPNAASITDVTFIVPGSVTHSQDWTQRANHLDFTVIEGGLAITLPSNQNAVPLGYHMLFLINGNGVPSVAEWVRALPPTPGMPGDFNNDNTVDARDYLVFKKGLGTTYDYGDYVDWQRHYGQTGGGGSNTPSVAEPSAVAVILVAMVAALDRRIKPIPGNTTL
jgi:hypothetical protein